MNDAPLPTYRPDTWNAVTRQLNAMSDDDVRTLAVNANITSKTSGRQDLVEQLLRRGGFLLVALGLTTKPDIMTGTVFSCGGLEYIINADGASMLATGSGSARLQIIGGGKSQVFRYAKLLNALIESVDFDQMTKL